MILNCNFCGKECKNTRSLASHVRFCKLNPNHVASPWIQLNTTRGAWNKGLTAETDKRLAKSRNTLIDGFKTGRIVSHQKGKAHTDEEKQKISESRKAYLAAHPDKVPYLLNHHSKGDSYPEQYFKNVFDNAQIDYKQNYYQSGYFLDFAWPDKKQYIEIDGEQHYVDKRIVEHDKVRTSNLLAEGWTCVKRIRWSEYQAMSDSDKHSFIQSLLTQFGLVVELVDTGDLNRHLV